MSSSNLKIFLSIFLSLIIFFSISYIFENPQNTKEIIQNIPNILSSSFQSFNPIKLLSQTAKNVFNSENQKIQSQINNNNQISFNLPTSSFKYISPTSIKEKIPTKYILPQKKISITPTKITNNSPTKKLENENKNENKKSLPPIKSDERPGNSLDEIFEEVSQRTCFPKALLWAFKTVETGERFKNESSSTIKIYNTYGWWKNGKGDPCYGYGYHTQTGIIPQDSINAGSSCAKPIGSKDDLKIMGLFQISEWEEQVSRKQTIKDLPENIDRRVFFDNALIFSYITKNRIPGGPPQNCQNWPENIIKKVAEKHHGVCQYDYGNGAKGDYCQKIIELYKKYK
ncbi:MAG: hypothetical protein N2593_00235 [Patescibacteria group bacterium]|nr:hypothetical protein [Patescibacteria group bacterium]